MNERPSFDLRTEPWILARIPDGTVKELSLRDVFSQAHEIRDLVGELPTQVFAITRLLLAILHRSLPEIERPVDDWAELWNMETLPTDWIFEYLEDERWADRFDLLHPEKPFYQVADLHTAKGETFGLDRLMADLPKRDKLFFTMRRTSAPETISFAEAARWLVHVQAFDIAGIKSGAVGDSRVKEGKGHPKGPAWAGKIGGVLLEGASLKETLLLNLVLGETADRPVNRDDTPLWERPTQTAGAEKGETGALHDPAGQVDLFTWQSRRVRLVSDVSGVSGVLLANGDDLSPENRHSMEPMTTWRGNLPQGQRLGGTPNYWPILHSPERSFWRGLSALIPQGTREKMTSKGALSLPLGTFHWLQTIRNHGWLSLDFPVSPHAYGLHYPDKQQSTIGGVIDDSLAIHFVLLAEEGLGLVTAVEDMVSMTEHAVRALVDLSLHLRIAGGDRIDDGSATAKRQRKLIEITISEHAYFVIDSEFREWLRNLSSTTVINEAKVIWATKAEKIIRQIADRLVKESGPVAWVGRDLIESSYVRRRPGEHREHVSSPEAHEWFLRSVRKTFSVKKVEDDESSIEEVR